ncbi:MAG: hypothetical protein J3Q66DRAFT_351105 [Benniella sp.]|nr:MAG: hypothetical protein J3Q66DRAFT_351105 [Benniella sp.]
MVFRQLGLRDLAQCARVSKKWHTLVMPYLWCNLRHLQDRTGTGDFRRIVLEDYLAERQHQELQGDGHSVGQSTQGQPSPPLPTLSKYGHCIRILPCLFTLRSALEKKQEEGPTEKELILHLFKRCSPGVQVDHFWMNTYDLDLELDNPARAIVEFTLPRVRRLSIQARYYPTHPRDLKLLDQLDKCSLLEKLAFMVQIESDMEDIMKESIKGNPKGWTSLRKLTLTAYSSTTDSYPFWSRLFRRCGSVKKLRVKASYRATANIQQGMLAYMHNVCEISLGGESKAGLKDDEIATFLTGSCTGWRVVKLKSASEPGILSMDALAKHFSTLEVLVVDGIKDDLIDVVQVPRSCAELHTLAYIDTGYCGMMNGCSEISAKVFVDQDPDTGVLKPWKCEDSLKVLKVMIVGIPRPDLKGVDVIEEVYPGEGREIQGQVYDRLARLTNLETLWLGDECGSAGVQSPEMSLESGLGKLSGLKQLKELNVAGFLSRIGVEEVQWMVENWPELRVIYGFDNDGFGYGNDGYSEGMNVYDEIGEEAVAWLKENHPEITVVRKSWRKSW